MNIFLENHLEVLTHLIKHDVRYLLIGGFAVIYYGYERTTGDMDLWIDATEENKQRLLDAIREMDYDESDIETLKELDFTKEVVFSLGKEPDKIDFITKVQIVKFEEAYQRKKHGEIDNGIKIDFVHFKDLVIMKMNTGRLKDQADIEELQRIMKYRNKT